MIYVIIGILLTLGFFILLFFLLYKKRQNLNQKKISDLNQELLQSQLEIQEQTLHKISQEIHDNIGQVLSLAKLTIGTIDPNQPEGIQQRVNDSRNLVGKAIHDLRDLSRSMNTAYISEMGLLRSIEYEVEMIRKTGKYNIVLNVDGKPVKLDGQKELILFRIIQEVLNNILKHADAKTVTIQVSYEPQHFSITITDDGKGFDITLLDNGKNSTFGLGLRNMQNRAQLVGASFSLASIPGKGTTVSISLPASI